MDGKERNEIVTWRKVLSYQSVGAFVGRTKLLSRRL